MDNSCRVYRHTAGLVIDIMLNVTKTEQRKLAYGVIDVLVRRHSSMLWSDLIYANFDGGITSYFHIPAGGGYGGEKLKRNKYTQDTRHGDHIHVDWVDVTLKNTGPEYLRIPYKWSKAAHATGFTEVVGADFLTLATAPGISGPVPAWLQGWWEVGWRSSPYFYLFERNGQVRWSPLRPQSNTQPIQVPRDTGDVTVTPDGGIKIRWGATGSVETFKQVAGIPDEMKGTWNGREPLSAWKL